MIMMGHIRVFFRRRGIVVKDVRPFIMSMVEIKYACCRSVPTGKYVDEKNIFFLLLLLLFLFLFFLDGEVKLIFGRCFNCSFY
jgi:hypothetical protein